MAIYKEYKYQCKKCGDVLSVVHSADEFYNDELSNETVDKLGNLCKSENDKGNCELYCLNAISQYTESKAPALITSMMSGRAERMKIMKERATERYMKEGKEKRHEIEREVINKFNRINQESRGR